MNDAYRALTRRQLLAGLSALPLAFAGCSEESTPPEATKPKEENADGGSAPPLCADPFAGGTRIADVPFTNEDVNVGLDKAFGVGLTGRLYTDLKKLEADRLVTENERYYIRTRYPDRLDPAQPWKIAVSGLVKSPRDLVLSDLTARKGAPVGPFVMECSGNGKFAAFGMLSAARWSGVPLADILALVEPTAAAKRVLVGGFDTYSQTETGISTPGASWIFSFDDLVSAGALLALEMNGAPLPNDHGFPVRLIVPNWYGCTCIKWVDTLTLVGDDEPATSQMKEFAVRTHQTGVPTLAREYRPATMDQAAMPVRVEKWRVGSGSGGVVYRVVGVMWGGYQVTDKLGIRFAATEPWTRVDVCPKQTTNATWTLWSHAWRPTQTGSHAIELAIDDEAVPTRRLDMGFYVRTVDIDEVSRS
jgi:DMSO/TMAO reductase YedYZ molybdopterin-dependent catalytic subunit